MITLLLLSLLLARQRVVGVARQNQTIHDRFVLETRPLIPLCLVSKIFNLSLYAQTASRLDKLEIFHEKMSSVAEVATEISLVEVC